MERILNGLDRFLPESLRTADFAQLFRARMLVALLLIIPVFVCAVLVSYRLVGKQTDWVELGAGIAGCGFLVLLPVVLRTGAVNLPGNIVVGGLLAVALGATATTGGAASFPMLVAVMLPGAALLICGRRSGLIWALVTAASIAAIGILSAAGFEFPRTLDPLMQTRQTFLAPILQLALMTTLIFSYDGIHARAVRELSEARADVRQREAVLSAVFEEVPVGLVLVGAEDETLGVNPFCRHFLPLAIGESFSQGLAKHLHPEDRERVLERVTSALEGQSDERIELRLQIGDAEEWCSASLVGVRRADGSLQFTLATLELITDRKDSESKLHRLAMHDVLTGLPNRRYFQQRLEAAVARAREKDYQIALLFVDLDGFKGVNDEHGHAAGDFVLEEVSERLASCIRYSDHIAGAGAVQTQGNVSRIGGDEFTILLSRVEGRDSASVVAARVLDAVAEPIVYEGSVLDVQASIGIAMLPEDASTADELLNCADAAMYVEKRSPSSGYRFYSAEHETEFKTSAPKRPPPRA